MCCVVQQMGELLSLKQQQKDSGRYQAAIAARAATGAVAANLRKRCNQCEACLTSQVCTTQFPCQRLSTTCVLALIECLSWLISAAV